MGYEEQICYERLDDSQSKGRQIAYTYDSSGRLWKASDVLDKETTYSYDPSTGSGQVQGWLTNVAKPGGRESNITYNDIGNVVAVHDEEGKGYTLRHSYKKAFSISIKVDVKSQMTKYIYSI